MPIDWTLISKLKLGTNSNKYWQLFSESINFKFKSMFFKWYSALSFSSWGKLGSLLRSICCASQASSCTLSSTNSEFNFCSHYSLVLLLGRAALFDAFESSWPFDLFEWLFDFESFEIEFDILLAFFRGFHLVWALSGASQRLESLLWALACRSSTRTPSQWETSSDCGQSRRNRMDNVCFLVWVGTAHTACACTVSIRKDNFWNNQTFLHIFGSAFFKIFSEILAVQIEMKRKRCFFSSSFRAINCCQLRRKLINDRILN